MPPVISLIKQWPQSLAKVVSESVRSEVTESVADFRLPIVNFLKARPVLKIGNRKSATPSVASVVSKIVTALELASIKTRHDWPTSIYFYRITSQKICMTNQF